MEHGVYRFFFFQAEDGIRDFHVTGVQTCALPISSHAAQVQSRVKKLDKIEKVEPPKRRQTIAFEFPAAPRSGEDVVSLKDVHKAYGSRRIYAGLDFMVRRKERWCVMGVNGAGKSTLLKLIAGSTEPDVGSVTVGGSVRIGYFAQHAMDLLD